MTFERDSNARGWGGVSTVSHNPRRTYGRKTVATHGSEPGVAPTHHGLRGRWVGWMGRDHGRRVTRLSGHATPDATHVHGASARRSPARRAQAHGRGHVGEAHSGRGSD